MTESNLQQKILHYCKNNSILAVKTDASARRGWPDLTVLPGGGRTVFVELKTERGVLSKLQKVMHARIRQQGNEVHVIRDLRSFITLMSDA